MEPPRTTRRILSSIVLAACAALAGPIAVAAPAGASDVLPSGYRAVTVAKDGFTIAVPDTWLTLDPKSKAYSAALKRAAAANPKLATLLNSYASLASSDVDFVASDTSEAGVASNLSVLALPVDKSALSDLTGLEAALAQGTHGAVTNVHAESTTVAGVPGVVATATLTANDASGQPVTAFVSAYFVPARHGLLDFDFSSAAPGAQDPVIQTIAGSLRLAGAPPVMSAAAAGRYVSTVCGHVSVWDDKTSFDISNDLDALSAGRATPTAVRAKVSRAYTSEAAATNVLIKTTRHLAPPAAARVAAPYLQNLQRARDAYQSAAHAAGAASTRTASGLRRSLTSIDTTLSDTTSSLGDPLDAVTHDATLAKAIQTATSCGPVLDAWRPAPSGLVVGDCTTSNETKVACTQPHTDEVSLVTTYPAGPTAPWPGNDVMNAFTNQTCDQAFTADVNGTPGDSTRYTPAWFSPNAGSDWNGGDREVVCTVETADQSSTTRSVKDGG